MSLRWIALTTFLTLTFTAGSLWLEQSLSPPPSAKAEVRAGGSQIVQPLIQVLITGAVKKPGIYKIPRGSRLADLLTSAGGLNNGTELSEKEQLRLLKAGEIVNIPTHAKHPPQPKTKTQTGSKAAHNQIKMDLNRADKNQLQALPGVGPALAERILAYRNSHKPFAQLEDLLKVKGIGPAKLKKIKAFLS